MTKKNVSGTFRVDAAHADARTPFVATYCTPSYEHVPSCIDPVPVFRPFNVGTRFQCFARSTSVQSLFPTGAYTRSLLSST